jgi:hypothetical protein
MKSDDDLEETIRDVNKRKNAAPEGSAAHRLAVRELEGLLVYEMAQPIMEDFGPAIAPLIQERSQGRSVSASI